MGVAHYLFFLPIWETIILKFLLLSMFVGWLSMIGRPIYTKIGNVSSYCDRGITASGLYTRAGTAGGDYWLPLGSVVEVAGFGYVTVDDRGVPGIADIDLWSPSCTWSLRWGRRYVPITVWRWGW